MGWINYVLIAVIAAAAVGGIVSVVKHAKGQGACCGGGGIIDAEEKKTLEGPVREKYVLHIEGMHCDNCRRAIERRLNKVEGALCRVDLKSGTATVLCDRPVDPQQLRLAVTMLDYQVTGLEIKEV